jgi:hypothetical protein
MGITESRAAGTDLLRFLRQHRVTPATQPPSTLGVLPRETLPELQCLIVAWETYPAELIKAWGAGRRFFNFYGPAEIPVCATFFGGERCDD